MALQDPSLPQSLDQPSPQTSSIAQFFPSTLTLKTLLLDKLLSDLSLSPRTEQTQGWELPQMPEARAYVVHWDSSLLVSDDFLHSFEVRGLPPVRCARGETAEETTLQLRLIRWSFQIVPSGNLCSGREDVKVYILARQWQLIQCECNFLEVDVIPQRIESAPGIKSLVLTAFVAETEEPPTTLKQRRLKSKEAKARFETPPNNDQNAMAEENQAQDSQQTSRFGIGNTESDYSFKETPEQVAKKINIPRRVPMSRPKFLAPGRSAGIPGLSILELLSGTVLDEEINISSVNTNKRDSDQRDENDERLDSEQDTGPRQVRRRSRSKSKRLNDSHQDVITLSSDAKQGALRQKNKSGLPRRQSKKVETTPFLLQILEAEQEGASLETNSLSGMSRAQTCQKDTSQPKKLRVRALLTSSAEKPANLASKLRDRTRMKKYVPD